MNKQLATWLAGMALCLATGAALAHDHEHDHAAAAPATLQLNHGQKWPTDASLRQGMSAIRDAVAAATPGSAAQLAAQVNARIAGMIQNCQLDRETDAMLHLVLADLIAATDSLPGEPAAGMARLKRALDAYAAHFDHPGWPPAK